MAQTQAERKAETRARLLAAGADLFADHGIDGVSVDAVAEASPEDFYQTLAAGADAVGAAGADLMLIDPQYSRFLAANANLQPYLAAFQAAATLPGVGIFHRYDIMRDWAENGDIDLEHAPKAERQAAAVRLHVCLGKELAKELLSEAQEE